jgi:hypothetical protein
MQQRRYRPGDVLDDYCPRERRITDHAIVAMIDDTIKQTRCVVCDAEHAYKNGRLPAPRRRKTQAALFAEVLDGLQPPQPVTRAVPPREAPGDSPRAESSPVAANTAAPPSAPALAPASIPTPHGTDVPLAAPRAAATSEPDSVEGPDDAGAARPIDEGPVRRQLIRAALPRPEGQPPQPTRAIPEFTIRQTRQRMRPGRRRGVPGPGGIPSMPGRFGRHGSQTRLRRRRGKKG